MTSDDTITSREFTREMSHVKESLGRIEAHLEKLNGKTATNTEEIRVLKRDVEALVTEDLEIDRKVDKLTLDGCAHYQAHTEMLQQMAGMSAWTPQKKAAVAGSLLGGGALMWPAIQKVAEAVHAMITHAP